MVWSSSSSVKARERGERTSNKKERKKKPWAGRFKAASQSCWSGGSASVWTGFSPAGAAEQHASSSSSSCYPTFSSVTSLPYGPSPPLPPHPSLSGGEEHLHMWHSYSGERESEREIEGEWEREEERKKEREKKTDWKFTQTKQNAETSAALLSLDRTSVHICFSFVEVIRSRWEMCVEKSGGNSCFKSNCVLFFVKVTVKCWAISNRSDSSALLLEMHKWSEFCWCNLQLTWPPLSPLPPLPSNLFTSVYLYCNYPGKMSIIRILMY